MHALKLSMYVKIKYLYIVLIYQNSSKVIACNFNSMQEHFIELKENATQQQEEGCSEATQPDDVQLEAISGKKERIVHGVGSQTSAFKSSSSATSYSLTSKPTFKHDEYEQRKQQLEEKIEELTQSYEQSAKEILEMRDLLRRVIAQSPSSQTAAPTGNIGSST